jgi:hypothetical protein
MKKMTALVGMVGLGAAALLCSGEASASVTTLRSALGTDTVNDTGETPAGSILRATLTLNGSGSISDIIPPSNSGFYSNRLATLCPDNTVQDNTVIGSGTVFFDLVHLCAFGFAQPLFIGSIIDDL